MVPRASFDVVTTEVLALARFLTPVVEPVDWRVTDPSRMNTTLRADIIHTHIVVSVHTVLHKSENSWAAGTEGSKNAH